MRAMFGRVSVVFLHFSAFSADSGSVIIAVPPPHCCANRRYTETSGPSNAEQGVWDALSFEAHMDIYLFCLILGVAGLGAMAISGLSHHGGGSHGHGGHGHAGGHGHGSHGHGGHGHDGGHAHGHAGGGLGSVAATWMLMSPRFMFAGLFGFGLIGMALKSFIGGMVLLGVAIVGAIVIERLLVAPLWKFTMKFESHAATTLESATFAEATVVSNFDRNGQGIIAVEVDGQIQQVLATLAEPDRAKGARVRAGQMVRVEEVDTARHRCTVSVI
jgi:hypothetical protein